MLKGVISISGQSGLFKVVAETKNNVIVESLETGKRVPAYSTHKISALDDVAIYTNSSDIPLKDVFKLIYDKESGGASIDPKSSSAQLKKYFEEILPDFDKERVYVSDIKKVLLWYNILQKKEMLIFEDEEQDGDEKTSMTNEQEINEKE